MNTSEAVSDMVVKWLHHCESKDDNYDVDIDRDIECNELYYFVNLHCLGCRYLFTGLSQYTIQLEIVFGGAERMCGSYFRRI